MNKKEYFGEEIDPMKKNVFDVYQLNKYAETKIPDEKRFSLNKVICNAVG